MSTSTTATGTLVRTETLRGETTLATVVDREISACINAETTLTVEVGNKRWRVAEREVTYL